MKRADYFYCNQSSGAENYCLFRNTICKNHKNSSCQPTYRICDACRNKGTEKCRACVRN